MSRFYWERKGDYCWIYDRPWSNTIAIATCSDDEVAEMICQALNTFWSKPQ